jgi:hypothetical protein
MVAIGNAFHDEILVNGNEPLENKLDALRKIDQTMGEQGTYTRADVEEYLATRVQLTGDE